MFNPVSLVTGDLTNKLLIGGALAVGVILLINANKTSSPAIKGLDGSKPKGGKNPVP